MTDTMPPRQVTALHRNDYLSQDVFERELRQVFAKQWLVVGHVSLVRNAGDYFVKQVGPESLLIARDKEMRLRAYFNVCRHRGFRLCSDGESGNARRLTCPYHGWSYGIDGALRTVPGASPLARIPSPICLGVRKSNGVPATSRISPVGTFFSSAMV